MDGQTPAMEMTNMKGEILEGIPVVNYEGTAVEDMVGEAWETRKKCIKCQNFYTEKQQALATKESPICRFHSGKYVPVDIQTGVLAGWSCCRMAGVDGTIFLGAKTSLLSGANEKALDKNLPGCCVVVRHVEDVHYTQILASFPFDDSVTEVQPEPEAPAPPVVYPTEPKDEGSHIVHYVAATDTLVGISLKYNVPAQVIQRYNKMFSRDVISRKQLLIPKPDAPAPVNSETAYDRAKEAAPPVAQVVE